MFVLHNTISSIHMMITSVVLRIWKQWTKKYLIESILMSSTYYPDSNLLSEYPDNTDICFSSNTYTSALKPGYNCWPMASDPDLTQIEVCIRICSIGILYVRSYACTHDNWSA